MSPHSEEAFLELVDQYFPDRELGLSLGRGDDGAIIPCGDRLCISSDLFLEGVHFSRSYFSPRDIGYKSLAVNISDLAAMAAVPRGFVLNLLIPSGLGEDFWQQYFRGLGELAREHGMYLAGGDISRSFSLGVGITVWGDPGERFMTRGGEMGDLLFLLGELGLSETGRHVLQQGEDRQSFPGAVKAHLRPGLYVEQALRLGATPQVRGLMDISDGLARDLPRFLGPGPGAELWIGQEDLHPEVRAHAARMGTDAVELACSGGEDYALLGAVDPSFQRELAGMFPEAAIIGRITGQPGIRLNGEPLAAAGFDHLEGSP